MKIGIDIGSTTIKIVAITEKHEVIYKSYDRHYSKINDSLIKSLNKMKSTLPELVNAKFAITGSAGMSLSEFLKVDFVQEVYATKVAVKTLFPNTDVAIELGGEDAKILFLTNELEFRMNGTCAGGTGAFIDQISTLLHVTPDEMNGLSKNSQKIYPIASRCGVFAKSDIQPLLNQGATKEDLSASIFQSVVNQTIVGLAQGRKIKGKVLYLGGPLTFLSELRNSFDNSLSLEGICPENSLYYVSIGSAILANTTANVDNLIDILQTENKIGSFSKTDPLFDNESEYRNFIARHNKAHVETFYKPDYDKNVYIGIDAGSTTIKMVALDEHENILFSDYKTNGGNPIFPIKDFLEEFYNKYKFAKISSAVVTGYGEELIKNAFNLDFGVVETMAHYKAAKKFNQNVDFIIDIGGQDIKCFSITNGYVSDIFLNEACSSGCGSFLQSFAAVLGYDMDEFSRLALNANSPVDLGSRCTVFMNSSIKQAQKDSASPENISAGLAISIIKNAIYKVIRAKSATELGENIVVQGGTFLSDAVLRAFEKEIGGNVVRPNIAGIMGAFGAALYGKEKAIGKSTILSIDELDKFSHKISYSKCKGCTNLCALTINIFDDNRKYIIGNKCDTPIRKNAVASNNMNIFSYKRKLLKEYINYKSESKRGRIGLPFVLNFYELLPFWHKFFTTLGFEVVTSDFSTNDTYLKGQYTIASDTICFPAKLVHGHIENLIEKGVDTIFYPCMSYNLNEERGDNHYNCPVVAYYPETIANNVANINKVTFIYDYIGIHRPKDFSIKIKKILGNYFKNIPLKEIKNATNLAFLEHEQYITKVKSKATEIITNARSKNKRIIVLAGRPYHLDKKVNHGIDKLISSFDVGIVSEDSVAYLNETTNDVNVLNQWTFHSRLYDAAHYVNTQKDMDLIQLVSFGCGLDAITTDEIRDILKKENKFYTLLKIDEITNLGAAKIRIRSLLDGTQ